MLDGLDAESAAELLTVADKENAALAPQAPTAKGKGKDASRVTSRRYHRESMYVELFQEIICTVLEVESCLFSEREQLCFATFFSLSYDARYLFVRLLQRKRAQWYRLDRLEYADEIPDMAAAVSALTEAFAPAMTSSADSSASRSDAEVYRFAHSDAEMPGGLRGRLALLTVEELKRLAKKLGVCRSTNRAELIDFLLAKPTNATLFSFGKELGMSLSPGHGRVEALLQSVMPGGCVCLVPAVCALMDRVALVYYRGRPALGSMLTAAVLSRTRKCHYPIYARSRTAGLFASREHVFFFEEALAAETQMEEWVDEMRTRPEAATDAVQMLDAVWPRWQHAIQEMWIRYPDGVDAAQYGRMRFHHGWVLTRVVYKACECLARLKQHEREKRTLRALLHQRFFRRGRRGAWYDRLALIVAKYTPTDGDKAMRAARQRARQICIDALSDADTHIIFVFGLQRRLQRLESQLRVARSERRDFAHNQLKESRQRDFVGTRLANPKGALALRPTQTVLVQGSGAWGVTPPDQLEGARGSTKSVWLGRDGKPCYVENFCLQEYALQGYRGFHCEGSVVMFLFALLMWDVLFAPVEGAFETAYQREPLDLPTDVFCVSRGDAIAERLRVIEQTGGVDIVRGVDARERPSRTWALGCRWDAYTTDELCEITECFGGRALSFICRLLCEDWDMRTSGFPDLCLWRYSDKKLCFSEVKGPGDRLSETQRVWIDALLRAGVSVEIARIHAAE